MIHEAVSAFHALHGAHAPETQRAHKRVLACLVEYCGEHQLLCVDQITVEDMDGYALWRDKADQTRIKEMEIFGEFFAFCIGGGIP